MVTLIVKDLEQSSQLDQQAMRQVVGGSKRMSGALFQTILPARSVRGADSSSANVNKLQSSPLLRAVKR